jgi:nitroimidazol reductase NimA-like FMN-containing flavoprotein (pyridoxamine 5'-phosphate oxidase superfamily)
MGNDESSSRLLAALLAEQRQAVLATQQGDQPYPSLMTFAATDDLRRLLLVTRRGTAKFANLQANPRAALLIDDRTTHPTGEDAGLAVTATGLVREVAGPDLEPDRARFVARHPELTGFVASPGCALLSLQVERYLIVRGLHDVQEWVVAR